MKQQPSHAARTSISQLFFAMLVVGVLCCAAAAPLHAVQSDARLKGAYTFERGGWTYVHLEGTAEQIGFQHGYLLSAQILDTYKVLNLEFTHSTNRDWNFFREISKKMLWPHIEPEYQQELKAIAEGAQANGLKLDVYDIVAMNASMEIGEYYVPWLDKQTHATHAPSIKAPGNCSAFIATGSYTKGGKIVLAHNNWSSYADGSRWTVMFDIAPAKGHHILMDGLPGVITSNDDFGENDAGIMIAETTITQFLGLEFGWHSGVRAFPKSAAICQLD